jgi:S1-C subfamily serine protease
MPAGTPAARSLALVIGLSFAASAAGADPPPTVSIGTAFEVTDNGHFLTNHHVVKGCRDIHLRHGGAVDEAGVIAIDEANDLALLLDARRVMDRINYRRILLRGIPYARFREEPSFLSLGESVVAVGYPLQDVLAGINVTTGIVSGTAGAAGDSTRFQITAPIQPGNSGGPVLDSRGQVIGVVVAQLGKTYEQQSGIIPQNVNFAIQGKIAREFVRLKAGPMLPPPDPAPGSPIDTATIATRTSEYTFMVICRQ